MKQEISPSRKAVYYVGNTLIAVGFLVFASVFVSVARAPHDPSHDGLFARALMGMGVIVLGGIISAIGSRGLAGSGVVLDPKKAREDLEPYSRMAGGMVMDALDSADIDLDGHDDTPDRVVMIRCQACQTLNEEGSKFCQECGKPL